MAILYTYISTGGGGNRDDDDGSDEVRATESKKLNDDRFKERFSNPST